MNRRGFLGALSRAPIIGALAGRQLAQKATADLAGITLGGAGVSGMPSDSGSLSDDQWHRALSLPFARQALESDLYGYHRTIGAIDYDIAAMRSWSLAAKVTYQRQRRVAEHIESLQHGWAWSRLNKRAANMLKGVLGL